MRRSERPQCSGFAWTTISVSGAGSCGHRRSHAMHCAGTLAAGTTFGRVRSQKSVNRPVFTLMNRAQAAVKDRISPSVIFAIRARGDPHRRHTSTLEIGSPIHGSTTASRGESEIVSTNPAREPRKTGAGQGGPRRSAARGPDRKGVPRFPESARGRGPSLSASTRAFQGPNLWSTPV